MSDTVDDQLLTEKALRALLGNVSSMTVWRWMKRGLLPQPIKLGARNFWYVREVRAFLAAQPRRDAEGSQAA